MTNWSRLQHDKDHTFSACAGCGHSSYVIEDNYCCCPEDSESTCQCLYQADALVVTPEQQRTRVLEHIARRVATAPCLCHPTDKKEVDTCLGCVARSVVGQENENANAIR